MNSKSILLPGLALVMILALAGCNKEPEKLSTLETKTQKVSYSIGVDIGARLKEQSFEVDGAVLAQGIRDAMNGESLMTEEEVKQTLTALQQEMMQQQMAEAKATADENLKTGTGFLEENKTREGVVELESGLQYKVLEEGTGASPSKDDKVTVHYKGTLVDGTEFDSSHKRGQPATFPVTGVIPGWTQALPLMKEGAKWMLYVPPDLAYGERQVSPQIGPNSTLIFEVELLDVVGKGQDYTPEDKTEDEAKPAE